MFHAPPSSGPLQALLGDIAMRAFDLSGADRQVLGQGVPVVQLIAAIAQIAMASPYRRLFFVHVGAFAVARQLLQHVRRTPCFERVLLSLHPGLSRGGVRRDRLGGGTQILADMIEINQVAALSAKLLLHLAYDPGSSVSDRVDVGVRAETGPNRAFEKLPSGRNFGSHPAASASLRSPSEFSIALTIDTIRARRPGCAWRTAKSASSLSFAVAIAADLPSIFDSPAYCASL